MQVDDYPVRCLEKISSVFQSVHLSLLMRRVLEFRDRREAEMFKYLGGNSTQRQMHLGSLICNIYLKL